MICRDVPVSPLPVCYRLSQVGPAPRPLSPRRYRDPEKKHFAGAQLPRRTSFAIARASLEEARPRENRALPESGLQDIFLLLLCPLSAVRIRHKPNAAVIEQPWTRQPL